MIRKVRRIDRDRCIPQQIDGRHHIMRYVMMQWAIHFSTCLDPFYSGGGGGVGSLKQLLCRISVSIVFAPVISALWKWFTVLFIPVFIFRNNLVDLEDSRHDAILCKYWHNFIAYSYITIRCIRTIFTICSWRWYLLLKVTGRIQYFLMAIYKRRLICFYCILSKISQRKRGLLKTSGQ